MPNYLRAFRPGGTFFLTLVTERRAPMFADAPARSMLHAAFEQCRRHHPFVHIHYNPVKHQYARCPHAWPHSSFHRFVAEKRYTPDWCCQCERIAAGPVEIDGIARGAGE